MTTHRHAPLELRAAFALALASGVAIGCGGGKAAAPAKPVVVEGVCQIAADAGDVLDADAADAGDAGDAGAKAAASATQFLREIGCTSDFQALASAPLDVSLPGARSVKVVLDQVDGNAVYFQNSVLYQVHYQFASTHLSGNGLPIVGALADFNATEYYKPDRRFILGAVT